MIAVYVALLLLPIAVIIFLGFKKNKPIFQLPKPKTSEKGTYYERERNIALNITPTLLKLNIPEDEILVYGIVMDMDLSSSFITLACYITGAANLYFSTGSAILGGGKEPKVAEAAVELVTDAQEFLQKAHSIVAVKPSEKGILQFYFLTNKGKFYITENLKNIEDNSSEYLHLFEKCSKVITEMHKIGK